MKFTTTIMVVMGIAGVLPKVFGGTVITSNLPPNTAIVNISGTQDGAATYTGDTALWYHPFYTSGATQLLEITVPPGIYGFRIVDPADAAQLFPALTSAQTNQIFTAWTYNSPWITDYLVFDGAAATNFSIPQLFDGAPSVSYGDPVSAYEGAVSTGVYNKIRAGPLGRDETVLTNDYTITATETLIFVVPDYGLSDNAGGVSVLISPLTATPPLLTIMTSTTNTVTIQWPTNASGYNLEQETNLAVGGWSPVTNVPLSISTNFSVTLPLDSTNRFFRLSPP